MVNYQQGKIYKIVANIHFVSEKRELWTFKACDSKTILKPLGICNVVVDPNPLLNL